MDSNEDRLRKWAKRVLDQLFHEFASKDSDLSRDLAACDAQKDCQKRLLDTLRLPDRLLDSNSPAALHDSYAHILAGCVATAYEKMRIKETLQLITLGWRRLYADACLIHSALDCLLASPSQPEAPSFWKNSVGRLDHAIIIAGAPGVGRLDLILDTIHQIQETHIPTVRNSDNNDINCKSVSRDAVAVHDHGLRVNAHHDIPSLARAPSFSEFQSLSCLSPFVIRGYASHWPAIADRRWSSESYLRRVAGRGRLVPVEVGADYRTDTWRQELMDWESFLAYLWSSETERNSGSDIIYLAQHNLFKQFPDLGMDIIKPDYVYCSLGAPNFFPQYSPPANEEQLVMNAWLGPAGTVSPAHTDPYFNFYVQVVGRKTIWLAPPSVGKAMSAFSDPLLSSNPAQNHENPSMSNTSQLDVFASTDADNMANFGRDVVPHAMSLILEPGDMLFFPPGWWHAMRSETVSFSVSMWF